MLCTINFPDWIQAICAFATLILTAVVVIQQMKIKTLTDVVKSLNDQATISQQLLAFEIRTKINDIQPNFITHTNKYENGQYNFSFKNIGQRARNFMVDILENIDTVNINNPGNKVIAQDNVINGSYTLLQKDLPFSFKLIYDDNNGQRFIQTVSGDTNKRLKISLPENLESKA